MESVQQTVEATAKRQGAFEEAATSHLDDLFRAALSMLGNRAEAEDAVQETYLRAWKAFDRFCPGTNCRAWLFKILINVVRNHRRRWFRRMWTSEDPDQLCETLVYQEPLPAHLTDEEILAAFQKIPPYFAEVVLLADVYEFSYKEVQETLEIPIGTVMSRLSRGRDLLRTHLAGSDVVSVRRFPVAAAV